MGARKLQSQADEVAWAVPLGSPESLLILAESWDVIFHVFMIKNTQITNRMQTSSSLYLQWGLGEWYRTILLTWSSALLCCLGQNSSLCVWNLPNSVLLLSGDIKVTAANTAPGTSNTLKDGLGLPSQPSALGIPSPSPPAALREHGWEAVLQPQGLFELSPWSPSLPSPLPGCTSGINTRPT